MKVENKEVISGSFKSSRHIPVYDFSLLTTLIKIVKKRKVYDFSLLTTLIKIVKKRKQKMKSKI